MSTRHRCAMMDSRRCGWNRNMVMRVWEGTRGHAMQGKTADADDRQADQTDDDGRPPPRAPLTARTARTQRRPRRADYYKTTKGAR